MADDARADSNGSRDLEHAFLSIKDGESGSGSRALAVIPLSGEASGVGR